MHNITCHRHPPKDKYPPAKTKLHNISKKEYKNYIIDENYITNKTRNTISTNKEVN